MGTDVLTMVRTATDERSFAAVFNRHHRATVRLAYLLVGDAELAEDVVAEAFAKVYVRWRRGGVDDVAAYVRRAVVNEANSKLRRRYLERGVAARRDADDRGVRLVEDDAADRDATWRALGKLPPRQRAAVVLRYHEDLSEADTAAVMGCSVGAVKSQTSRGLQRLRQLLEPGGDAADVEGGR